MRVGILLCLLGALSFGLSACVSKIADRQHCRASGLIASVFGWATVFMLMRTLSLGTNVRLPGKAAGIAVGFGVCAAIAIFAFQTSMSLGKVTVPWLVMNLSAGVPAVVSILVYGERLTLLKSVAFVVAIIAMACLFQGKKLEAQNASGLKRIEE
jgi:drug/metabolite transporter (DMT)-like permease